MERTIISWNLPNWISVFLMGAAGYAVVGLAVQAFKRWGPQQANTNATGF